MSLVHVLAIVGTRAPLAEVLRRRRPPHRATRRRCYPRPRADALGRFAGSISLSRCKPCAESCPLAQIRMSSPKFLSTPPLAGVSAADRAPPFSPQSRQPSDLDPTAQIQSDLSQYRSTAPCPAAFAKESLGFFGFASRSFRSSKFLTVRSFFFRFSP